MLNKILPMTGVKPQTSDIESDRYTNWATTTSLFPKYSYIWFWNQLQGSILHNYFSIIELP